MLLDEIFAKQKSFTMDICLNKNSRYLDSVHLKTELYNAVQSRPNGVVQYWQYNVHSMICHTSRARSWSIELAVCQRSGVPNLFWHEIYFYICQPLEVYQFYDHLVGVVLVVYFTMSTFSLYNHPTIDWQALGDRPVARDRLVGPPCHRLYYRR